MIPYYQPRFDASEAGWRARERGDSRDSNPHARGAGRESVAFQWWDSGWIAADEEIQMEKENFRWEDEE